MQRNEIIQSALQSLGINSLTPMQKDTIEQVTKVDNVVLLSPTGSGKTLAYLLPLLLTMRQKEANAQAMIIAPSRELVLQVNDVFKAMRSPWKACCCYGGHPMAEERKSIAESHPDIIIGTPGRITDHLSKETFNPATVRVLIIDEFDKALEFGFHDEMAEIIARLSGLEKRILLSATDMEEIPPFVGMERAVKLNYIDHADAAERQRLTLKKVMSPEKDKVDTLYRLLCQLGNSSSIVFCNHREAVDRLQGLLSKRKFAAERFHGGMEQPDRERALYKFRNGSCYTLISTDLASRGLDIPLVEHIIHYHLPINEEAFTHRNGRTARWNATGTSYLILHGEEKVPPYIKEDLETMELPQTTPSPAKPIWATIYIGKGKKEKLSRGDIAGFLYKKGNLSKDDLGAIDVREHYSFVAVRKAKVRQLLNLIQGEKIKGMKTVMEEAK